MTTIEEAHYLEQVERAERLATVAHYGQTDKAGEPYINHPYRVVGHYLDRMAEARHPHDTRYYEGWVAAWLHDVAEDTPLDLRVLGGLRFPERSIEVVGLLTHDRRASREAYYERIATDSLAVMVKVSDMDDNTDPRRLARLDLPTADRLRRKYATGYAAFGVTSRWEGS